MVAIYVFLLMMVAKIAHSRKKRVAADEGEVGWVFLHKILYLSLKCVGAMMLARVAGWCSLRIMIRTLGVWFCLIGPASAAPHMTLEFVPTSTWWCLTQEMHWDLPQLLDPEAFFSGLTKALNVTRWFHKHLNHNATRPPSMATIASMAGESTLRWLLWCLHAIFDHFLHCLFRFLVCVELFKKHHVVNVQMLSKWNR